jgi:hypothetical protein
MAIVRYLSAAVVLAVLGASPALLRAADLAPKERKQLEGGLKDLQERLAKVRPGKADLLADAEVFAKGLA